MQIQWLAAICIAVWVSPLLWSASNHAKSPQNSLALYYGGTLTLVPIALIILKPGRRVTRLTIAVTQMLMSSLLIHLTGGRIETHFHIFGSLAFLACYLDWEVLVVASATIAVDHLLRTFFLPFSVFGTDAVQPWRWVEHMGWVVFCDIFLIVAIKSRIRGLRTLTARHSERAELLRRAYYDTLTGLPNRAFLSEELAEAIAKSTTQGLSFACLYVDLDRFKDINDHLGHAVGDALLRLLAERMREKLGNEPFLARIGGDEFVVLLLENSTEVAAPPPPSAEDVARDILRSLLQPFSFMGREMTVGASIGISRFPQDGDSEADLLSKSDRAMYRVKRAGRNGYQVYSSMLFPDTTQREEAEKSMVRALAEGEFSVYYQPIFHSNGAVAGLEALMRWQDPVRGFISPANFIPVAEETGLIVQLGNFVLQQACKHAAEWRSLGLLPGRIAVNVSSLELARENFAEGVIATLMQHNVQPDAIDLEVTESALVDDFALAERHLQDLRRFGLRISIDDFGTGYSSLSRLRQLTLDTLKIDRLFVEGVASSEADRTVVQHIIAMAHTLGMTVVAEGVETEAQVHTLCGLGCDQLQGHLLARPADKQATEEFLIRNLERSALSDPQDDEFACS